MGTIRWEDLKDKLKARARFTVGFVVMWRGRMCRISGRYWRHQLDVFVYDLREIGPDGQYVRNHYRVPEGEMVAK